MSSRSPDTSPRQAEPAPPAAPLTPPRGLGVHGRSGATLLYVALTQGANIANYASNLAFSRQLGKVGFGELTALLALALILAVPLGAAQTIVAERVALAHAAGDEGRVAYLARHALGHVLTIGSIVGILYVALIPLTERALDIREPGPVIALAPFVVLNFVVTVASGVLQGTERWVALGWLVFASAASRIAIGLPWAAAGGGAGGAIAGQAVGSLLVLSVVGWRFRAWWSPRGTGAAKLGIRRRVDLRTLSASGAFIGFAVLSNFDLVLSRLFLTRDEAGVYAALSTVAKLVIFLPTAIAVLMVPRAVKAHAIAPRSGAAVLRSAVGLTVAAAIVVGLPAIAAPQLLVDVMFGDGYGSARDGVLPMVIAGGGLAMLYVICTYSVAIRDRRWLLLLLIGVTIQVAAICTFNASPVDIAWAQAATVVAVLVINELAFHSIRPRPSRGGSDEAQAPLPYPR